MKEDILKQMFNLLFDFKKNGLKNTVISDVMPVLNRKESNRCNLQLN